MDIERRLRAFLREAYQVPEDDLATDQSLTESGVVDSSGILELIDFLETEFSIVVSDEEIAEDHFEDIQSIVRFVQGKRG